MGMKIFESSGTFSPSSYGLSAGDVVDVICVGGGSSGVTATGTGTSASVSGGTSSFGSTVSSANGITMAKGGAASGAICGGGAGGYMPGISGYGGNGGTGSGATLCGMAGGVEGQCISPWANPRGPGNKGAGGGTTNLYAPGGNGYGAGGGGLGSGSTGYGGGDAGKIAFGSVVFESTSSITVTVGAGGVNAASGNISGAPGVVLVFW